MQYVLLKLSRFDIFQFRRDALVRANNTSARLQRSRLLLSTLTEKREIVGADDGKRPDCTRQSRSSRLYSTGKLHERERLHRQSQKAIVRKAHLRELMDVCYMTSSVFKYFSQWSGAWFGASPVLSVQTKASRRISLLQHVAAIICEPNCMFHYCRLTLVQCWCPLIHIDHSTSSLPTIRRSIKELTSTKCHLMCKWIRVAVVFAVQTSSFPANLGDALRIELCLFS